MADKLGRRRDELSRRSSSSSLLEKTGRRLDETVQNLCCRWELQGAAPCTGRERQVPSMDAGTEARKGVKGAEKAYDFVWQCKLVIGHGAWERLGAGGAPLSGQRSLRGGEPLCGEELIFWQVQV